MDLSAKYVEIGSAAQKLVDEINAVNKELEIALKQSSGPIGYLESAKVINLMNAEKQNHHGPRYCARYQSMPHAARHLAIGIKLDLMIRLARKHHEATGHKVWVWELDAREIVFRLPAEGIARAAGGGQ